MSDYKEKADNEYKEAMAELKFDAYDLFQVGKIYTTKKGKKCFLAHKENKVLFLAVEKAPYSIVRIPSSEAAKWFDLLEVSMLKKKVRKPYKIGDKVWFHTANGDVDSDVFDVRPLVTGVGYSYLVKVTYRTDTGYEEKETWIHWKSVFRAIRRKAKTMVVWTTFRELENVVENRWSSAVFRHSNEEQQDFGGDTHAAIPLRPLTDKERKKWGV